MKLRRTHKGGALISAIFITAIVAMLATALAVSQRYLMNNAQLVLRGDALYWQLQGAQFNAENLIHDYLMQWIAAPSINAEMQPLKNKITDSAVETFIDDEQGKYNLNNLVYFANQPGFVALLQAVMPSVSKEAAYNIAKSITAWETDGSQDPYYLSLHPAYRSSKNEMANITELRLIAGVTPEIYSALVPYVTALPLPKSVPSLESGGQKTAPLSQINVNSVSAEVLVSLDPALSFETAKELVACRQSHGVFAQSADFLAVCGKQAGVTALNNIVTQSQYFQVTTVMKYHEQDVFLKSLLVTQTGKNNKLTFRIVWQAFE